jgi:hypothetical protein
MGVVSIALPNFEEVLLKKSFSKVCLEKLCNPQELQYLKGTVSWDFQPMVFFVKQYKGVHWNMG